MNFSWPGLNYITCAMGRIQLNLTRVSGSRGPLKFITLVNYWIFSCCRWHFANTVVIKTWTQLPIGKAANKRTSGRHSDKKSLMVHWIRKQRKKRQTEDSLTLNSKKQTTWNRIRMATWKNLYGAIGNFFVKFLISISILSLVWSLLEKFFAILSRSPDNRRRLEASLGPV